MLLTDPMAGWPKLLAVKFGEAGCCGHPLSLSLWNRSFIVSEEVEVGIVKGRGRVGRRSSARHACCAKVLKRSPHAAATPGDGRFAVRCEHLTCRNGGSLSSSPPPFSLLLPTSLPHPHPIYLATHAGAQKCTQPDRANQTDKKAITNRKAITWYVRGVNRICWLPSCTESKTYFVTWPSNVNRME